MKATRKLVALCIIGIIVVSAVVAAYFTRLQVAPQISLAPTTFVAVQGTQIAFTVYGLESNAVATVYFGDGHEANTTSTVTYSYPNPGRYLIAAEEYVDGRPVSSTFNALQTIQVTSQVTATYAPVISVPVVSFDISRNPSAPVVHVGDDVALLGGYLQPPSGTNITVSQYVWDFGNGVTKTVAANSTSLNPIENPVTTTFGQAGLYAVTLTLVTENVTSMATYRTSVEQSLAVGSNSQPYGVFLYAGVVPNPSVINVAENAAGGPYSFDPDVGFDDYSFEIIINIFNELVAWNGSSVTNFIPMAAAHLPSVSNGEISPDYKTYTFQIRTGFKFSNGDPLTAYDVWYSTIRWMLFVGGFQNAGVPGSSPIMTNATDTADYSAIMNAVSYDNASNTFTLRFARPVIPSQVFDQDTPPILDSRWLEQVGAGITFTPAGFYAYQNQRLAGNYNLNVQWAPVASGPYMIQSYIPDQSITLVPNPGFETVPGIPAANNTVVIQWVKDPKTAYDLFRSGQADILSGVIGQFGGATNLYFPQIKQQVANGQAAIYQFPSAIAYFFAFNININENALNTDFGSQYHIPANYFANLDVRKAFAYAFNYTNYVDVIQGNTKYGTTFAENYAGLIVPGQADYVPETEFQNVPTYNLTYAKELLQESGEYNVPVDIPLIVWPGDPQDVAAVQMWATAINSIDPSIIMTATVLPYPTMLGYAYSGGPNPMPMWIGALSSLNPSGSIDAGYKEGPGQVAADGWTVNYLNSSGNVDQAAMFAQMNSLIDEADSTANATLAAQDYRQVEQIAINLYMYVYTGIPSQFWVVKPYMTGYQGQISYQMNPYIGGLEIGLYFWWVKGCENRQACSGRGIGP